LKNNSSVRSPKLAGSAVRTNADLSLGDTLRKAKKDLFFARCIYGMLFVLLVTGIVLFFVFGYAEDIVDWFYSIMG